MMRPDEIRQFLTSDKAQKRLEAKRACEILVTRDKEINAATSAEWKGIISAILVWEKNEIDSAKKKFAANKKAVLSTDAILLLKKVVRHCISAGLLHPMRAEELVKHILSVLYDDEDVLICAYAYKDEHKLLLVDILESDVVHALSAEHFRATFKCTKSFFRDRKCCAELANLKLLKAFCKSLKGDLSRSSHMYSIVLQFFANTLLPAVAEEVALQVRVMPVLADCCTLLFQYHGINDIDAFVQYMNVVARSLLRGLTHSLNRETSRESYLAFFYAYFQLGSSYCKAFGSSASLFRVIPREILVEVFALLVSEDEIRHIIMSTSYRSTMKKGGVEGSLVDVYGSPKAQLHLSVAAWALRLCQIGDCGCRKSGSSGGGHSADAEMISSSSSSRSSRHSSSSSSSSSSAPINEHGSYCTMASILLRFNCSGSATSDSSSLAHQRLTAEGIGCLLCALCEIFPTGEFLSDSSSQEDEIGSPHVLVDVERVHIEARALCELVEAVCTKLCTAMEGLRDGILGVSAQYPATLLSTLTGLARASRGLLKRAAACASKLQHLDSHRNIDPLIALIHQRWTATLDAVLRSSWGRERMGECKPQRLSERIYGFIHAVLRIDNAHSGGAKADTGALLDEVVRWSRQRGIEELMRQCTPIDIESPIYFQCLAIFNNRLASSADWRVNLDFFFSSPSFRVLDHGSTDILMKTEDDSLSSRMQERKHDGKSTYTERSLDRLCDANIRDLCVQCETPELAQLSCWLLVHASSLRPRALDLNEWATCISELVICCYSCARCGCDCLCARMSRSYQLKASSLDTAELNRDSLHLVDKAISNFKCKFKVLLSSDLFLLEAVGEALMNCMEMDKAAASAGVTTDQMMPSSLSASLLVLSIYKSLLIFASTDDVSTRRIEMNLWRILRSMSLYLLDVVTCVPQTQLLVLLRFLSETLHDVQRIHGMRHILSHDATEPHSSTAKTFVKLCYLIRNLSLGITSLARADQTAEGFFLDSPKRHRGVDDDDFTSNTKNDIFNIAPSSRMTIDNAFDFDDIDDIDESTKAAAPRNKKSYGGGGGRVVGRENNGTRIIFAPDQLSAFVFAATCAALCTEADIVDDMLHCLKYREIMPDGGVAHLTSSDLWTTAIPFLETAIGIGAVRPSCKSLIKLFMQSPWDVNLGPVGYQKILQVVNYLTSRPDVYNDEKWMNICVDFIFAIDKTISSFPSKLYSARVLQIECVANLCRHGFNLTHLRENIRTVFVDGLTDADVRVRLAVAQKMSCLLSLFQNHSRLYDGILQHIKESDAGVGDEDELSVSALANVPETLTLCQMFPSSYMASSPALLHVAIVDLFCACNDRTFDAAASNVETLSIISKSALQRHLLTVIAEVSGYPTTQALLLDHIYPILQLWIRGRMEQDIARIECNKRFILDGFPCGLFLDNLSVSSTTELNRHEFLSKFGSVIVCIVCRQTQIAASPSSTSRAWLQLLAIEMGLGGGEGAATSVAQRFFAALLSTAMFLTPRADRVKTSECSLKRSRSDVVAVSSSVHENDNGAVVKGDEGSRLEALIHEFCCNSKTMRVVTQETLASLVATSTSALFELFAMAWDGLSATLAGVPHSSMPSTTTQELHALAGTLDGLKKIYTRAETALKASLHELCTYFDERYPGRHKDDQTSADSGAGLLNSANVTAILALLRRRLEVTQQRYIQVSILAAAGVIVSSLSSTDHRLSIDRSLWFVVRDSLSFCRSALARDGLCLEFICPLIRSIVDGIGRAMYPPSSSTLTVFRTFGTPSDAVPITHKKRKRGLGFEYIKMPSSRAPQVLAELLADMLCIVYAISVHAAADAASEVDVFATSLFELLSSEHAFAAAYRLKSVGGVSAVAIDRWLAYLVATIKEFYRLLEGSSDAFTLTAIIRVPEHFLRVFSDELRVLLRVNNKGKQALVDYMSAFTDAVERMRSGEQVTGSLLWLQICNIRELLCDTTLGYDECLAATGDESTSTGRSALWDTHSEMTGFFVSSLVALCSDPSCLLRHTTVVKEEAYFTLFSTGTVTRQHSSDALIAALNRQVMQILGNLGPPNAYILDHGTWPSKIGDALRSSGGDIEYLKRLTVGKLCGFVGQSSSISGEASLALEHLARSGALLSALIKSNTARAIESAESCNILDEILSQHLLISQYPSSSSSPEGAVAITYSQVGLQPGLHVWDSVLWNVSGQTFEKWICTLVSSLITALFPVDNVSFASTAARATSRHPSSSSLSSGLSTATLPGVGKIYGSVSSSKASLSASTSSTTQCLSNGRAFFAPLQRMCLMSSELAVTLFPLLLNELIKSSNDAPSQLVSTLRENLISDTCEMQQATILACESLIFLLRQDIAAFLARKRRRRGNDDEDEGLDDLIALDVGTNEQVLPFSCRLPGIDYAEVAAAAVRCGLHCTALLLHELSLEADRFSNSPAVPENHDGIVTARSVTARREHTELLVSICQGLHDPDAIFGVKQRGGSSLQLQALQYARTSRWMEALTSYESLLMQRRGETGSLAAVSAQSYIRSRSALEYSVEIQIAKALRSLGCQHVLGAWSYDTAAGGVKTQATEATQLKLFPGSAAAPIVDLSSEGLWRTLQQPSSVFRTHAQLADTALRTWHNAEDDASSFRSSNINNIPIFSVESINSAFSAAILDLSSQGSSSSVVKLKNVTAVSERLRFCTDALTLPLTRGMAQQSALEMTAVIVRATQLVEISEYKHIIEDSPLSKDTMQRWRRRLQRGASAEFASVCEPIVALRLSLVSQLIARKKVSLTQVSGVMDDVDNIISNAATAHSLSPLVYRLQCVLMEAIEKLDSVASGGGGSSDTLKTSALVTESWKLQESRLLWKKGQADSAKDTLDYHILSKYNKDNEPRDPQIRDVYSEALRLRGEWAVAGRSAAASFILNEYLHPSLKHAAGLAQRIKAHRSLAFFNARLHHASASRLSSGEWKQGLMRADEKRAEYNRLFSIFQKEREQQQLKAKAQPHCTNNPIKLPDDYVNLGRYLNVTKKEIEIDESERTAVLNAARQYLLEACTQLLAVLQLSTQDDLEACFQLISLWLDNSDNPEVNGLMLHQLDKVPTFKLVPLTYQIFSRLNSGDASFLQILSMLVYRMCKDHPHHTLHQLMALAHVLLVGSSSFKSNASIGRCDAAKAIVAKLKSSSDGGRSDLADLVESTEALLLAYIEFASIPLPEKFGRGGKDIKFREICERGGRPFNECLDGMKVAPTVLTASPAVRVDKDYRNVVQITSFRPTFIVSDSGISHPKIIDVVGSDDKMYRELVKSGDDTRQDAVMQQVFEFVNYLLRECPNTRLRRLVIKTYKIVPLTPQTGVIEWVNDTIAIGSYLTERDGGGAHTRYRPQDWSHSKCRDYIRDAGNDSRDRLSRLQEIYKNFKPVFRFFALEHYPDPQLWLSRRLAYTRSVAVTSIVGYILGIGDRHSHNILITSSAELLHIDFGIVFEQGKTLGTPETVPFRLTRDIVDAMGSAKCEGAYRRSCEEVLRVLRENTSPLLTILGVVIHDPLYKWSLSPLQAKKRQAGDGEQQQPEAVVSSRLKAGGGAKQQHAGAGGASTAATEGGGGGKFGRESGERALGRIKAKLLGLEDSSGDALSVEGHVDCLINEAQSMENLCKIYQGWSQWM